jgi:hypothetical protein
MKQPYHLGVTTVRPLGVPLAHSQKPPITKVEKMLPKQTQSTTPKTGDFPARLITVPTSPSSEIPTATQTPTTIVQVSGISHEDRVQERAKTVRYSRKIAHFRAKYMKKSTFSRPIICVLERN